MLCKECGEEIPEGYTYCINCGVEVEPHKNKKSTSIIDIVQEKPLTILFLIIALYFIIFTPLRIFVIIILFIIFCVLSLKKEFKKKD